MAELKKLKNKITINNSGISLVEVLITILIGTILIVSLLTLTNFNVRNSLLVTENQDAINSANILLETLRTTKDVSFPVFMEIVHPRCQNSKCYILGSEIVTFDIATYTLDAPVSYFGVRKISDKEVEINIMTEWKVGNTRYSSPLSTIFTDWRSQ